jgi:23S rRNA (guanosine2251-2'-O)-methyltransferase
VKESAYIYGRNPVLESIRAGNAEKVVLSFGVKGEIINAIYAEAKKNGIKCVKYDKRKFSELEKRELEPNANTQGVIALKKLVETLTIDELIEKSLEVSENPVLVALDSIYDPHNLGAISRSVECSGANGIIIPERDSAPLNASALKSSAGALELINIAKVGNMNQALEKLKEKGFWIYGTDMNTKSNYFSENLSDRPLVLIIGSEGKGIRPATKKHCDNFIKIPMKGKLDSLNASVSAGIILFEIMKQKYFADRKK